MNQEQDFEQLAIPGLEDPIEGLEAKRRRMGCLPRSALVGTAIVSLLCAVGSYLQVDDSTAMIDEVVSMFDDCPGEIEPDLPNYQEMPNSEINEIVRGLNFEPLPDGMIEEINSADTTAEVEIAVNRYFERFDFGVIYDRLDTPGLSDGLQDVLATPEPVNLGDAKRSAIILAQEFSFMPRNLVLAANIGSIRMVSALIQRDSPEDSLAGEVIQEFGGRGHLVLDAGILERRVVHHEFWHQLDFQMCGKFLDDDSAFSEANPVGFQYPGQRDDTGNYSQTIGPYLPSVREDKAETYASLWYWGDVRPFSPLHNTPFNHKQQILQQRLERIVPGIGALFELEGRLDEERSLFLVDDGDYSSAALGHDPRDGFDDACMAYSEDIWHGDLDYDARVINGDGGLFTLGMSPTNPVAYVGINRQYVESYTDKRGDLVRLGGDDPRYVWSYNTMRDMAAEFLLMHLNGYDSIRDVPPSAVDEVIDTYQISDVAQTRNSTCFRVSFGPER